MSISQNDQIFFHNEGYIIIRKAFDREEINEIKNVYKKHWLELIQNNKINYNKEEPLDSLFTPIRDYHWENPYISNKILKKEVIEKLEALLGEEMLVITTNYYYKAPGMSGMEYHQDNYGIGVNPGTCYAVWIGLDDANQTNGGLRFLRGTHMLGLIPEEDLNKQFPGWGTENINKDNYEVLDIVTKPGDVVIYHGNLIHSNTSNTTGDHIRRSLVTHFCGISVQKVYLNFNNLMNKKGEKIRRRINLKGISNQ